MSATYQPKTLFSLAFDKMCESSLFFSTLYDIIGTVLLSKSVELLDIDSLRYILNVELKPMSVPRMNEKKDFFLLYTSLVKFPIIWIVMIYEYRSILINEPPFDIVRNILGLRIYDNITEEHVKKTHVHILEETWAFYNNLSPEQQIDFFYISRYMTYNNICMLYKKEVTFELLVTVYQYFIDGPLKQCTKIFPESLDLNFFKIFERFSVEQFLALYETYVVQYNVILITHLVSNMSIDLFNHLHIIDEKLKIEDNYELIGKMYNLIGINNIDPSFIKLWAKTSIKSDVLYNVLYNILPLLKKEFIHDYFVSRYRTNMYDGITDFDIKRIESVLKKMNELQKKIFLRFQCSHKQILKVVKTLLDGKVSVNKFFKIGRRICNNYVKKYPFLTGTDINWFKEESFKYQIVEDKYESKVFIDGEPKAIHVDVYNFLFYDTSSSFKILKFHKTFFVCKDSSYVAINWNLSSSSNLYEMVSETDRKKILVHLFNKNDERVTNLYNIKQREHLSIKIVNRK
jgi:hypothetical protein